MSLLRRARPGAPDHHDPAGAGVDESAGSAASPGDGRLSRAERRRRKEEAAAQADYAARVARARKRLAQAGGTD